MKTYLVALSVLTVATLWLSAANAKPIETHRGPFALVELFTSEGCSSCPPAEAVANRLHRDALAKDQRVFVLAFHVDYWNRLGWADPFSDPAYSDRQRDYARAFRSRTVYTPQMVVNGQAEFVGSHAEQAQTEIDKAFAQTPDDLVGVGIALQHDTTRQTLEIRWQLDRLPDNMVVHFAVVEDGQITDVPRGENRGRTLRHDAVVRDFRTVEPEARHGEVFVELPDDLAPQQAAVVGFVQERTSRRIIGAHRVAFDQP